MADNPLIKEHSNNGRENRNNRGRNAVVQVAAPAIAAVAAKHPSWELSKYFFYGGCVVFVIVVIISVLKFSTFGIFTIDPTTGVVSRTPVTPGMQTTSQYTSSPIGTDVSTTFSGVVQTGYTVAFDTYISDATPINNYYRVIFYNGWQTRDNTPSALPDQGKNSGKALSFIGSTLDATNLGRIQLALQANGTNICLYIDPATNDLYLTYYVGYSESSGSFGSVTETASGWITSNPIQNVPIGKPFRITLIVDNQFIETYMNGELVLVTKTFIAGRPSNLYYYNTTPNYNFYGSPDSIFSSIKIANIVYWGQVIPSKSVRIFSSKPVAATVFTN